MKVEQETAVLVARYLVRRAKENVFGILVRNLPPFDILQLLNFFREARQSNVVFRLGLIGYDTDLPEDHEVVGTTSIATVVDWRNTTVEPKIVIVRENAPLLHSLNQFEQLKGERLYQIVADEAGRTTGLDHLWRVLKRTRVRSFIPLEGLLAYYTALLNAEENQRRFEAGKSLYLLGLLEDSDLFQDLAPAKMAQRLEQNHDYVTKIARMNAPDRQRLSRALRLPNNLAETYERIMEYYRRPQETDLKGLTLENVKKLWQLPEEPLLSDSPSMVVGDISDSGPLLTDEVPLIRELSPTRARETVEVLLDYDTAKRDELLRTYFDQLRERDQEIREDQNAGTLYQTQQLFERTLTERYWGGILRLRSPQNEDESKVTTLGKGQVPQRLKELYAYEFSPFDPLNSDRSEWQLADRLKRLVEEFELDPGVLDAFDRLQITRRILLSVLDQFVRYPLLTINSELAIEELDEELRLKARELHLHSSDDLRISLLMCGRVYLSAHSDLLRILRQEYGRVAQSAPFGIEQLCSGLLVLDTIIFQLPEQYQAILSPLHPLHLWKYVELSSQILATGAKLTSSDRKLLEEQADLLPNLVTTLYLSRVIADDKPHMLLETGVVDGIPYFEEYNPGSPGKAGTAEIERILNRFIALSPHAALGLRIAIVDAPDPSAIVGIIVRLLRSKICIAAHLRFFVTSREDRAMHAPLLDISSSDYMEQVMEGGYGALTVEIDAQPYAYARIDEELGRQPVHVALLFDPSRLAVVQIPRSFSILSPLCLPMKFHYDSLTDEVQIVPSADEGLFSYYNNIRNQLSGQLLGLTYGAKASLDTDHRVVLERLVKYKHAIWLVVVDRPREQHEQLDLPRISLLPSGSRDVQVFTSSLDRFEREFRSQLQADGYDPSENSVKALVDTLGGLISDGLLALITRSQDGDGRLINFEATRLHEVLGVLVAANWYYKQQHYDDNGCLLIGLDSRTARTWLRLEEHKGEAIFVGIAIDPTDSSQLYLDLLGVKTQEDQREYKTNGRMIGGADIRRLLATADLLASIFRLAQQSIDADTDLLVPARREILRQHLFRECFAKEHRSQHGYRRQWSVLLNRLFDPDKRQDIGIIQRLWLVDVGLLRTADRHTISPFIAEDDGRSLNLVRITASQVAEYVGSQQANSSNNESTNEVKSTSETSRKEVKESLELEDGITSVPPDADVASEPYSRNQSASNYVNVHDLNIEQQSAQLRQVLGEYGIKLLDLNPNLAQIGPSVIRYRVRLAPGTKLRDVQGCAEDVARELALHSVPIINNIPGEPFLAVDIERPDREIVPLKDVLEKLPLADPNELIIACGRTPAGNDVQLDIVKLPHLLVAGTTESGKTMFLCTLLISLLRRYNEHALQLLLIDPKVTNFVFFEGLPHLIKNRIFTDALEATEALQEVLTTELERRTALLTKGRQSNINNYNMQYPEESIPRILVVVDEYADLTAVLSKAQRTAFESNITRLAQRARSVGIHLVLATQRPSVDVVTGNLKANMPCRISFLLPSSIDSRTILDQPGAENLLGRGDMLLLHNQRLQRLQGYFVADNDIERLIHS